MSSLTEKVLTDVEEVIASMASARKVGTILDVGCWDGLATFKYAKSSGATEILGIEIFPDQIAQATARGVNVQRIDLEGGVLPFDNDSCDLVICNQVFEHLKGIFDLISEIHRVLKTGGHFIFSVPNLASFHNRLLLLLGMQPTSIRLIGPHVRGFSYRHTRSFLTHNGLFKIADSRGCGFYPFPIQIGRLLGRVWPGGSHTMVFDLEKTNVQAANWTTEVSERGFQTTF